MFIRRIDVISLIRLGPLKGLDQDNDFNPTVVRYLNTTGFIGLVA